MSWSYEPELDNDIYIVRFLLQDTVEDRAELQDEEIEYLISAFGSAPLAALAAARTLYARYSRLVSRAVGDLRISYSDRVTNWANFITQLESNLNTLSPARPYIGGLSIAEKDMDREDTDLVQPAFEVDKDPLVLNEDGLRRISSF